MPDPIKPGWTSARPDTNSHGIMSHPDANLSAEFAVDFDAVPRPSDQERAGRLKCSKSNMLYIPSCLAMTHVPMEEFYQQMANRQWQKAQPTIGKDGRAPAFLNRMGAAIGARRDMVGNQVADASRPRMPGGIATDWKSIPELQRINAYVFRGDRRLPRAIKLRDGFHPPSTRQDRAYTPVIASRFVTYMRARYNKDVSQSEVEDYIRSKGQAGKTFVEYELWREILKGEELHIGRMVADEFLKGFISTTRDVTVCQTFIDRRTPDKAGEALKAVYALHSEGGFLLPAKGTHAHASNNEAEVAHPGSLSWSKVKAFRIVQDGAAGDARTHRTDEYTSQQLVFVRKGFQQQDPTGAREVILALGQFF